MFLEASLGLGLVQQYEKTILYNDQPPYEEFVTGYERVYSNDRIFYEHSQVSLAGIFVASGSLMIGIKL
jgi:hypothetical protein